MNFVIILVVVAAAFSACYAQSNHAFWGQVGWNDTLVYSEIVNKKSFILREIELDVQYPPKVSSAHILIYFYCLLLGLCLFTVNNNLF